MSYRLAIDLGSSNTVAVLQCVDGRVRPLLFDGSELLPSAVCADAGGDLVVGRDAERLARADPAAYEPSPKRRIDDGTVLLGRYPVDVRDALAAVLTRVAGQLRSSGSEPGPVVLTCPAAWGAPRRQVLVEAGARAGLAPVTLVSEPIAAAAYFLAVLRCDLPPGATLMVVDLGAGTADVALMRRAERDGGGDAGLDVVAQAGLDVGGVDLDAALVDLVGTLVAPTSPDVWRALVDPATPAERRDRLALWQEVRAAKESLSRLSVAPVQVPGYRSDLHLTREELEARATPLLAPIGELAAEVVAAAGLTPDRLAGVFLVGGGSRLPLLARLLHTRLEVAPKVVERPETAVAEGALYAATASGNPVEPPAADPTATQPLASTRQDRRRGSGWRRWPTPAALVLVLLCFLLPFATVSCGLPDGYGRAGPGGTTTYAGVDLVWAGTPDVPAEHLRPRSEWRTDRLAPQPLLLAALLAASAAALAAFVVRPLLRRRAMVASLATVSALSLLAGQAVVVGLLAARVRAQSALPAGRSADEFVGTGIGFWLALALLTATAAGNAFGLRRHRHP